MMMPPDHQCISTLPRAQFLGRSTVFKEGFLPEVEEVDGDAVFLADLGDGHFFDEVLSEQGDFLFGAEVATLLRHGCSSARVLLLTLT